MSMSDFQFLLPTLASEIGFREDCIWRSVIVPGRFRIDPVDVPTMGVDPGVGEVETWFYCERAVMPRPLPELAERPTIVIREQTYEIVQIHEDDLGELGYRLIKQEIGLNFPDQDLQGDWDDGTTIWDRGQSRWDQGVPEEPSPEEAAARTPGRPSRREEIVRAYNEAATAGFIDPTQPLRSLVPAVRSRIPGQDRRGLGDKTMRRFIRARRENIPR